LCAPEADRDADDQIRSDVLHRRARDRSCGGRQLSRTEGEVRATALGSPGGGRLGVWRIVRGDGQEGGGKGGSGSGRDGRDEAIGLALGDSQRHGASHDDLRHHFPSNRGICGNRPITLLTSLATRRIFVDFSRLKGGVTDGPTRWQEQSWFDQHRSGPRDDLPISWSDGECLVDTETSTNRTRTTQGQPWTSRLAFPARARFALRATTSLPNPATRHAGSSLSGSSRLRRSPTSRSIRIRRPGNCRTPTCDFAIRRSRFLTSFRESPRALILAGRKWRTVPRSTPRPPGRPARTVTRRSSRMAMPQPLEPMRTDLLACRSP